MTAALLVIVPLLLALAGAVLCAEAIVAPRARHTGAGVGALNVWQLVEHVDAEHDERIAWPTRDPDVVPPDLMQRVLDGLRAL